MTLRVDDGAAPVRLCDVATDGSTLLVTRGLLNLTRRDDMDATAPLGRGARYAVRVRLDAIGQRIPGGHRGHGSGRRPSRRPSPSFAGPACRLELPLRPPDDADAALPPFEKPEWSAPLGQEVLRSDPTSRSLARDLATGTHELSFRWDVGGHRRLDGGGSELDDTT